VRKISDRAILGAVAGLAGGAASVAMDIPLYHRAPDIKTWAQRATGITVSKKYYDDPFARTLGYTTSLCLSAGLGIAQAYTLSLSGKDYAWAKSLGWAGLGWIVLHGLGKRLSDPDSSPRASASSLASNLLNSAVTTGVICLLGEDKLFTGEMPLRPISGAVDAKRRVETGPSNEPATLTRSSSHRPWQASWNEE
jgi:hypothetical protein